MTTALAIDQLIKEAMIAKDAERLSVLRFLKSEIKYVAIEKKKDTLDDAETMQIIQRQIKKRKESVEQFKNGGRADLADKEARELVILEGFLPKQISDGELEETVRRTVSAQGAVTKKDFGRLMKVLTAELAGKAQAGRISEILSKVL